MKFIMSRSNQKWKSLIDKMNKDAELVNKTERSLTKMNENIIFKKSFNQKSILNEETIDNYSNSFEEILNKLNKGVDFKQTNEQKIHSSKLIKAVKEIKIKDNQPEDKVDISSIRSLTKNDLLIDVNKSILAKRESKTVETKSVTIELEIKNNKVELPESGQVIEEAKKTLADKEEVVCSIQSKNSFLNETKSLNESLDKLQNASFKEIKKYAIHDIQKSIQHIKLVNNFILKHQNIVKTGIVTLEKNKIENLNLKQKFLEDVVKAKFDKYRKKLRQQLLKTIDSIERFVSELNNDDKQLANEENKTKIEEEQAFFYNLIEKMMKLISSIEYDVFRVISKEIINCLIEISEKYFA